MKKNIAVVGCGQWGKNLVRNFSEIGSLYSICDLNTDISNKYAIQYKVKASTFEETINDPNIKGVVLTVPAHLHAPMAIKAMNKGKNVFVEKPLSLNETEAQLMISTSKENRVQLMVGHLLQYHPIFNTIKKMLRNGEIGDLKYIYSNRLGFGRVRTEEDVIWSFAPHDISMILSLTGENPEFVSAKSRSILQNKLADTATIHMDFKSGLKSHISVSWLNPYKDVKLVVVGKSKMIVFDDTKLWNEKLALYPYELTLNKKTINLKKSYVKYLEVPEEEPLKIECQHFSDVIEKNINPITGGQEGLQVIKILSAASKSQIYNQTIKL